MTPPPPQAENGFLQIPNDTAEKLARTRISGEEGMVLWAFLRKILGWHKPDDQDRISLSQLALATGLKRQTVLRAISKLSSKKIITVIKNDDSQVNTYRINKRLDEWQPLSKKITVIKNGDGVSSKKITGVIKKDNELSSLLGHTKETKETSTKETIQKKGAAAFVLPEWIPEEPWKAYLDMRVKIRKPITEHGKELVVIKLRKIMNDHQGSPEDVLNQSILNSWAGVFPIKPEGGNGNRDRHAGIKAWLESNRGEGRDVRDYEPEPMPEISDEERERNAARAREFISTIGP